MRARARSPAARPSSGPIALGSSLASSSALLDVRPGPDLHGDRLPARRACPRRPARSSSGSTGADYGPAVALVNGSATLSGLASLAAGSHTIATVYSGDPNFAPSEADLAQAVAPAPLTVTAADATRVYGQANPTFSASYSGFVLGEGRTTWAASLTLRRPATAASHVGSYAITPGGLSSANYAIRFVPGTLAVTPAPLTSRPMTNRRFMERQCLS